MTFLVPKWYFGPDRSILERLLKHFHIPFAINFPNIVQVLTYQKHSFRGVIAKIGYMRPISAARNHLRPIFMEYVMRIVPYGMLKGF